MSSILDSLIRGSAQGATANFGDEGSAKVYGLLNQLSAPKDPEGIGREYAAGSAEQDYLQGQRRDDSAAAKAHPVAYGAGNILGALPSTLALPVGGGGSAAARVAASGLTGGALGAVSGAGSSNGQNMAREAAKGAGLGGALGVGGASVIEAIPMLRSLFSSLPKTATASAAGRVTESGAINGLPEHQVQLNYNMDRPAVPPPKEPGSWSMPEIPKAGKTVRESMIPAMEAEAEAADKFTGAANKRMIDKSMRNPPKNIDRDVEYMKNMADQKEAGVARRAAEDAPAPELKATVKPPKKGGRAPAKAESPTQLELPLPERAAAPQKAPAPAPTAKPAASQKMPAIQQEFAGMDRAAETPSPVDLPDEAAAQLKDWQLHGYRDPQPALEEAARAHGVPVPTLHRGIQLQGQKQLRDMLNSGKFTQPNMASWTTDPSVASTFAGTYKPLQVRVAGERGLPIGGHESEVLVPGSEYGIDQVSQDPAGVIKLLLRSLR